jgi:hypothetical protein
MKIIQPEPLTDLTLETVTSGFLGNPVIYFLWNGCKLIAYSKDLKRWKFSMCFSRISVDNS